MQNKLLLIMLLLMVNVNIIYSQKPVLKIALLKYKGGGDWYANPTALPNLLKFCNRNLHTNFQTYNDIVEVGSNEIFNYPFIHMTGHGNVVFSENEAENLRNYLCSGGFLHIDDNYGLNKFVRREMKKVFPKLNFVELPFTHLIFHQKYIFKNGVPKIHEHDGKQAQAFGIIYEGRLVCFYTYETDLGDGWEDTQVHNDSKEMHIKALQMGANIISYCFTM